MKILITGGTGFLGRWVVQSLQKNHEVYLISRSPSLNKHQVQLDLTKPLNESLLTDLRSVHFDIMIHMAALYDLKSSRSEVYQNNLLGLQNSIKIAEILNVPFFVNTSSMAAGMNTTEKESYAEQLNLSTPFPDAYSQSKAFGENILIKKMSIPYKLNLRLGILTGDSIQGEIHRIDGPYVAPNLFNNYKPLLNLFSFPLLLPGRQNLKLPIVPVDHAAKAIVDLIQTDKSTVFVNNKNYVSLNLTPKKGVPILDFYKSCLKNLGIRQRKIFLMDHWPDSLVRMVSDKLIQFPSEQLNYILQIPSFNSDKTEELLGQKWCPEFKDYEKQFWMGYEKYISNLRN